jgi:hypothetical protein
LNNPSSRMMPGSFPGTMIRPAPPGAGARRAKHSLDVSHDPGSPTRTPRQFEVTR